jgi:hypothetical protein
MATQNLSRELAAFDAEVHAFAADYQAKADDKAGIQKGMDAVRSLFNRGEDGKGCGDDQWKNIANTQHRLDEIKAGLQSGHLSNEQADRQLAALEQSFNGEAQRVDQAQQGNARVGQTVHGAGRALTVGVAGVSATVASGGNVFIGAAAGMGAGSLYDAATVAAGEVDKKLGNGSKGDAGSGIAPQLESKGSIGGVLANAAAGEEIEAKDIVRAGVGSAVDAVSGGFAGQGALATQGAIAAVQATSQTVGRVAVAEAVAGASVKTAVQQSAATLGVQATGTAIDPALSGQQKTEQLGAQVENTVTHLPAQIVFTALGSAAGGSVQPANKALDASAQLLIDGASGLGEASVGNALSGRGFNLSGEQLTQLVVGSGGGKLADGLPMGGSSPVLQTPRDVVDALAQPQVLPQPSLRLRSTTESTDDSLFHGDGDAPGVLPILELAPSSESSAVPAAHRTTYHIALPSGELGDALTADELRLFIGTAGSLGFVNGNELTALKARLAWQDDTGSTQYQIRDLQVKADGAPSRPDQPNNWEFMVDPTHPRQFYVDDAWRAAPRLIQEGTAVEYPKGGTDLLLGQATHVRQAFDTQEEARQHFTDLVGHYAASATSDNSWPSALELGSMIVRQQRSDGASSYSITLPTATRKFSAEVLGEKLFMSWSEGDPVELLHTHPPAVVPNATFLSTFGNHTLSRGDVASFNQFHRMCYDPHVTVVVQPSRLALTIKSLDTTKRPADEYGYFATGRDKAGQVVTMDPLTALSVNPDPKSRELADALRRQFGNDVDVAQWLAPGWANTLRQVDASEARFSTGTDAFIAFSPDEKRLRVQTADQLAQEYRVAEPWMYIKAMVLNEPLSAEAERTLLTQLAPFGIGTLDEAKLHFARQLSEQRT